MELLRQLQEVMTHYDKEENKNTHMVELMKRTMEQVVTDAASKAQADGTFTTTNTARTKEREEDDEGKRLSRRTPLHKQRGVDRITTYDGDKAEFSIYAKAVMIHVADEPGLRDALKFIVTNAAIKNKEIEKDFEEVLLTSTGEDFVSKLTNADVLSQELHSLLMMTMKGTPNNLVDATDGNGFEAWRVLHSEYSHVTAHGKRQLLTKIIHPERVQKYEDILKAQADWEAVYQKYKDLAEKELDEDVLITGYMSMLPKEVERAIYNLDKHLETLKLVKEYVRKQVQSQDNIITPKSTKSTGNVLSVGQEDGTSNDAGYDEYMKDAIASMLKGYGKGKAGGGGDFRGTCYFCGEPGHSKKFGPKLDKIMEQKRAKGEGKTKGTWNPWPQQSWGYGGGGKGLGGQSTAQQSSWGYAGGGKTNGGIKSGGKGKGTWNMPGKGWKGRGAYELDAFGMWIDEVPQQSQGFEDGVFAMLEDDMPCETCDGARQITSCCGKCDDGGWQYVHPRSEERLRALLDEAAMPKPGSRFEHETAFSALEELSECEYLLLGSEQQTKAEKTVKMPPPPQKKSQGSTKKTKKKRREDEVTEREIDEILAKLEAEYNEENDDYDQEVCLFDTESEDEDLNMFRDAQRQMNDYVKVCIVVDSGFADNVTNRDTAPDITIQPSPGSRRRQNFVTADGKRLPNEGEQELQLITDAGQTTNMKYQITDVKKTLTSVSRLCDRGNRVTFGRGGGVIHNVRSGALTPFKRTGSIYTLDVWVKQSERFRRPS